MRVLFFIMTITLTVTARSQSKTNFTLGGEAGLLRGESDKSSYLLINYGIHHHNTTLGIGGGMDGYVIRSVPFYAMARQELGHHAIKPFVDFSVGMNITNPTDGQIRYYGRNSDFKNGFFLKSSAGVSVRIYHSFRMYLSGAYSYKTTRIVYGKYSVSPGGPFNESQDIYHMNRWCMATGFWF